MSQERIVDINKVQELVNNYGVDTPLGFKPLSYNYRSHNLVIGRAIVFNFLKNNGFTLSTIGRLFKGGSASSGKKDHATVIHGCKKYKEMVSKPKMYPEFTRIKYELESLLDNCFVSTYSEIESYKSVIETFTPIERMILKATEKAEFLHIQTILFRRLNQSLES